MGKTVGIVGAGISGLAACKYALSKGYTPVVFEAESYLGGVWAKTTETTRVQSDKRVYQFSDYPWPDCVKTDHPTSKEAIHYLNSYAKHFDVLKHIKFNNEVLRVSYEGVSEDEMHAWSLWGGTGDPFNNKGNWNLAVQDTNTLLIQDVQVNFLVLCIGRFNGIRNIPKFPPGKGPEVFKGQVIHSMDYSKMDDADARALVKGKRVAVVGLRKSAMDIALECANANGPENPCTLIYRKEHWNVPDYQPWGVPIAFLLLNRFAELLLHKPGQGLFLTFLAIILAPVRWAISKFIESHILRKLNLRKHGMVPNHSFHHDFYNCLFALVPEGLYDRVEDESIKLQKDDNFSFYDEGILVDGNTKPLKTDLVILATGFRGADKIRDIFVSPYFKSVIDQSNDSALPIYRECISPRIPQLAIIGFSESVAVLYTTEMKCKWLGELLDGNIKLPCIADMDKDILEWDNFYKRYSGEHHKRSCVTALLIWYNDQLCKDMGWNPRRKKNILADMFEPYGPSDYSHP